MRGSIRVLHVDDEPDFADLAASFLEREDDRLTVETATNVDGGLQRLAEAEYDCVVSDYDMPRTDGIEFLEAVREEYPDLPFILFTGKGSEEIASDAIRAGATDYLRKKGSTSQYAVLANRITNAVGQFRAERRARLQERQYRQLFEKAPVMYVLVRDEGDTSVIEDCNPQFAEKLGYDREDLLGQRMMDYYTDASVERMYAEGDYERARTEGIESKERTLIASGGRTVDTLVFASPRLDDSGDVIGTQTLFLDITERKERTRRLEVAIQNTQSGIWAYDVADGTITRYEGAADLWGDETHTTVPVEEAMAERVHPADRETVRDALDAAASGGDPYRVEFRHSTPDGYRWVEARGDVVRDGEDDAGRLIGFTTDVDERKERRRELEWYETIIEASGDAVYALDAGGHLTFVNDAFCELVGYTKGDLLGEHASFVMDEADVERGEALVRELLTTEKDRSTWEMDLVRSDGERITCETHTALLPPGDDGEFRGTTGIHRDITDRKRRAEAVDALHEATRGFMEASDKRTIAERAVETAQTVLDQPISGLWLHDADGDVLRPVAATEEGKSLLGDPPTYTGDGSLSWEAFEDGDLRVYDDVRDEPGRLNSETPIRSEIIVPLDEHGVMNFGATDPGEFTDIDISLAKILGNTAEAALSRADREQELRTQHRELKRQNERLEEFASVLSHDLRNPLGVAEGRLELARAECDSEHLADVADALDRMKGLIDDILTVAREGTAVEATEPIDLAAVVDACWRNVETAGATLTVDTDRTIHADPSRFQQLLENLVRNAIEHGGTDVTIAVGDLPDGTGFYLEDDGPGIPDDVREEVFESGYSTADEGTGFGLSIVREIAQAHGWGITLTDATGGGARFEITGVDFDGR